MIDEVEARHNAVEQAADRFESTRKRTFWIGGGAALATIPAVIAAGAVGLLLIVIAAVSVAASLMARARVGRAAKAEERALSEAGATSYLGFQLQRVNGLLANDTTRKALMDVAGARRQALAEWQQLAGDIPVDWAIANRDEIQEASRLRREVDVLGSISSTVPSLPSDVTGELAHVLVTRLAEARAAGRRGHAPAARRPVPAARSVGQAAPARAARTVGRRTADRVPHRGRRRRGLGPPRGADR